jgi:hypothetical protein
VIDGPPAGRTISLVTIAPSGPDRLPVTLSASP